MQESQASPVSAVVGVTREEIDLWNVSNFLWAPFPKTVLMQTPLKKINFYPGKPVLFCKKCGNLNHLEDFTPANCLPWASKCRFSGCIHRSVSVKKSWVWVKFRNECQSPNKGVELPRIYTSLFLVLCHLFIYSVI